MDVFQKQLFCISLSERVQRVLHPSIDVYVANSSGRILVTTRCEIYVSGRAVWFARKVVFGTHHCRSNYIKESQVRNEFSDEVTDSTCLYLRYKVSRRHQSFQKSFSNDKQIVLLEVLDFFMDSVDDKLSIRN